MKYLIYSSHIFIALFSLHTLYANDPLPKSGDSLSQLPHLIENDKWNKVNRLIKHQKHLSLHKLKGVLRSHHSSTLSRAASTVKVLRDSVPSLYIPTNHLLRATLFMEMKMPEYVKRRKYYLPRKTTGLPYALEVDPRTKNRFILLNKKIGSGAHKIVKPGFLYRKHNSEVIAVGTQCLEKDRKKDIRRELRISRAVSSAPGVVGVHAITKKRYRGSQCYSIFYTYYNAGHFKKYMKNGIKLNLKEKIDAAYDVVTGLHSLHSRGIAHSDLGAANFLIHVGRDPKTKKRIVKACIADLGRASYIAHLRDRVVQGHRAYTSPEGIDKRRVKGKDYLRADVYAVGCVLYGLFYEKEANWLDSKYVKEKDKSVHSRKRKLTSKIDRSTKTRREALHRKIRQGAKITPREELEYLILSMINPDPFKRDKSSVLKKKFYQLKKRIS